MNQFCVKFSKKTIIELVSVAALSLNEITRRQKKNFFKKYDLLHLL